MRNDPILIAAFEGWNDAGAAATSLVEALIDEWNAEPLGKLDEQEYYDFQVARPQLEVTEDGERVLVWPGTQVWRATTPGGREVLLVRGLEPSFNWQDFTSEIIFEATNANVGEFVLLGALLADVPHTRAFPISISSSSPITQKEREIPASEYEGPSGITGVLEFTAAAEGFETVSLWVSVPHYVADPPNPKAQLALLEALADCFGLEIATDSLPDASNTWEENITQLTGQSPEIDTYVSQLETAFDDEVEQESSSGQMVEEIEKFLRELGKEKG